jgi:hypothetical protein
VQIAYEGKRDELQGDFLAEEAAEV